MCEDSDFLMVLLAFVVFFWVTGNWINAIILTVPVVLLVVGRKLIHRYLN